jgi:hypothetical protein
MKVTLHFTTVYHSSADGQSERTNQTIEIVIRFFLMKGKINDFIKLLSSIQACMNNSANFTIELSPHEILMASKLPSH